MKHVDIISNDWSHAQQVRVARCQVSDDGSQIQVDADRDAEGWRDFVLGRLERFEGTPAERLAALEEAIRGDYLFATAPHGDGAACPYQSGSVAMSPVAVQHDDAGARSRR
jgi:hypothetical protein